MMRKIGVPLHIGRPGTCKRDSTWTPLLYFAKTGEYLTLYDNGSGKSGAFDRQHWRRIVMSDLDSQDVVMHLPSASCPAS